MLLHIPVPPPSSFSSLLRGWDSLLGILHHSMSSLCQIRNTSSANEAILGSHEDWVGCVVHIYGWQEACSRLWIFFGWWLRSWDLPCIQVCWLCWSSCGFCIYFWAFNSNDLSLMVIREYLLLFQSTAGYSTNITVLWEVHNRVSLTMSEIGVCPCDGF